MLYNFAFSLQVRFYRKIKFSIFNKVLCLEIIDFTMQIRFGINSGKYSGDIRNCLFQLYLSITATNVSHT